MAKQNKPSLGTTIRQNSSGVLAALMCIVIGLVIGLIALFIINPEHALVDGFWRILQGGFYDFPYGCGKVLTQTAPLIMTGLSVAFAFKTGLFNIGAAGQYTLGAFGALYFAIVLGMPWWVCLLLDGPRMLMNRNILYTAVTRARKCICIVGSEQTFYNMISNENEQKRFSSLDIRIKEAAI